MSREITTHKVNDCNETLTIRVMDEPGDGGACHRYEITGFDASNNPSHGPDEGTTKKVVLFQNGPILQNGTNGVTQEALLAIVRDRLEGFQSGPFACDTNHLALTHVKLAMEALHSRTKERMSRGVEGTHQL